MYWRIGIVGGGQLGKMLTLEAKKLGFQVVIIDPAPRSPAGQVADRQIVASVNDEKAIRQLARETDFLTFEIELANADILEELRSKSVKVNPSARTLHIIKDKLKQHRFLQKARIPVAEFVEINNEQDAYRAAEKFGYPFLVKARTDAYDGKGNVLIQGQEDIRRAFKKLAGRKVYAEKFVSFAKELSVIVVRSTKGQIVTYPVVETIQKNNICHQVLAPALVGARVRRKAKHLAIQVMRHLRGAGAFGIEMFLTEEGKVLVNEIAPRVHNSGHYTIEACVTSQFEQHIRAITGLPLGAPDMISPAAVMVNILGERKGPARIKGLQNALAISGVSVHIYGKAETKPERKMGHITVLDTNIKRALKKATRAREYIDI